VKNYSEYLVLAQNAMDFVDGAEFCKNKQLSLPVPTSDHDNQQLVKFCQAKGN